MKMFCCPKLHHSLSEAYTWTFWNQCSEAPSLTLAAVKNIVWSKLSTSNSFLKFRFGNAIYLAQIERTHLKVSSPYDGVFTFS